MRRKWGLVLLGVLVLGGVVAVAAEVKGEMTPEQALAVLEEAASAYRGTRADHVVIQQAVEVLRAAIAPKPKEEEEAKAAALPEPEVKPPAAKPEAAPPAEEKAK